MKTETVKTEFGKLVDIDLQPSGKFVAVFGEEKYKIHLGNVVIDAPKDLEFPMIRYLSETQVVTISTRVDKSKNNIWIYDLSGKICSKFCGGDGIQNILVKNKKIILTYFDEGIFGDVYPSSEGIAVFDYSGNLLFGYRSFFGQEGVNISDCYCSCLEGTNIWFSPYTAFPLVCLDVEKETQFITEIPKALHFASALAVHDGTFYFYSPYKHKNLLVSWRSKEDYKVLGVCPGPLRGLTEGRFLYVNDSSYTIITPYEN